MAALKVMEDASMEHAGIVMGSGRGLVVVVVVVVVEEEVLLLFSFSSSSDFFFLGFESKVEGVSSSQVPLTISWSDSSWSDDLRRVKRSEERDLRRPPSPAGRLEERDSLEALLVRNPPEVLSLAEPLKLAEARSPPEALREGMAE